MGNEVNEKFAKIIADNYYGNDTLRLIYNNQSNAQYLRLTEYDLLIHAACICSYIQHSGHSYISVCHGTYQGYIQHVLPNIALSFTFISTHVWIFYGHSLFGRCYHGYFIGYILEYCLLEYEQLDYGHSVGCHLGQVVATCKIYTIADNHVKCSPYKSQYMIQH